MYKLIKDTILKKTVNRRSKLKDWERFIIYVCEKKLKQDYTGNKHDFEKFEKMIQKFEKEEDKRINKELKMLLNPELDDFGR